MWSGIPIPCEECPTNDVPAQRRRRKHVDGGHFGDLFMRTKDKCQCLLLQNKRGIGFVSGKWSIETLEMECLKKECIKSDINTVGLTDVNKDWRNIPNENEIWNETASWRDNRIIKISQNYHYPAKSEFLVGGTASIVFEEAVFRLSDQGAD